MNSVPSNAMVSVVMFIVHVLQVYACSRRIKKVNWLFLIRLIFTIPPLQNNNMLLGAESITCLISLFSARSNTCGFIFRPCWREVNTVIIYLQAPKWNECKSGEIKFRESIEDLHSSFFCCSTFYRFSRRLIAAYNQSFTEPVDLFFSPCKIIVL